GGERVEGRTVGSARRLPILRRASLAQDEAGVHAAGAAFMARLATASSTYLILSKRAERARRRTHGPPRRLPILRRASLAQDEVGVHAAPAVFMARLAPASSAYLILSKRAERARRRTHGTSLAEDEVGALAQRFRACHCWKVIRFMSKRSRKRT